MEVPLPQGPGQSMDGPFKAEPEEGLPPSQPEVMSQPNPQTDPNAIIDIGPAIIPQGVIEQNLRESMEDLEDEIAQNSWE